MDKAPMTAKGHESLEAELKRLKTIERPDIIKAIAVAREHGDLSENAEYHAARERQAFVEGRIGIIEDLLSRAEVIDVSAITGKVIKFGATVKVADNGAAPGVLLPRSAVFGAGDTPRVWRIDGVEAASQAEARAAMPGSALGHVQAQAVQLGTVSGDEVRVLAGLEPGQWVVTAGVHDLAAGEPVSYYDSEPR